MKISLTIILLLFTTSLFAQTENKNIRKGNKQYDASKYEEAEMLYRKSIEENSRSFPANNNLGNALYRQEKYEEAAKQFLQSSVVDDDAINKADSYYNHGNAMLQSGKIPEAIEAYKNALRQNPQDEDARYNLAYAQQLMKKQQQQQNQDGNDQNNDENQQNKDQQKEKQQGDNSEEQQAQDNQQQEEKQNQEGKQQQAQKDKISKEDAERILQALKDEELQLQKKLSRKKGKRIPIEKDW